MAAYKIAVAQLPQEGLHWGMNTKLQSSVHLKNVAKRF